MVHSAALIVIVGIFVPVVIGEILELIYFIVTVVQSPGEVKEYLRGVADQYGLGWLFSAVSAQLAELPSQLGALAAASCCPLEG